MCTIGVADRLRFPRFPMSSQGAEMLAFADTPTGTTGLAIDQVTGGTVAPAVVATAIGVDTETGRATP
jgi:hypothetical protein